MFASIIIIIIIIIIITSSPFHFRRCFGSFERSSSRLWRLSHLTVVVDPFLWFAMPRGSKDVKKNSAVAEGTQGLNEKATAPWLSNRPNWPTLKAETKLKSNAGGQSSSSSSSSSSKAATVATDPPVRKIHAKRGRDKPTAVEQKRGDGDGGAKALRGRGDKAVAMDRPPIDLKSRKRGDGLQVVNGQKQLAVAGDGLQAIGLVTIPAKQASLTQTGGHHPRAHRIRGTIHELHHWVATHGRGAAPSFQTHGCGVKCCSSSYRSGRRQLLLGRKY